VVSEYFGFFAGRGSPKGLSDGPGIVGHYRTGHGQILGEFELMWLAIIQFVDGGDIYCVVGEFEDESAAVKWAEKFVAGTEFEAHVTQSVESSTLDDAEIEYLRSLKS
jgi:hypothetical protein